MGIAEFASYARPGQLLQAHLSNVSERAAGFAKPLGLEGPARYAGAIHDLGKYRVEFQEYLQGGRANDPGGHAVYGAAVAARNKAIWAAFSVAGHHAGLKDIADLKDWLSPLRVPQDSLEPLLEKARAEGVRIDPTPCRLLDPASQ